MFVFTPLAAAVVIAASVSTPTPVSVDPAITDSGSGKAGVVLTGTSVPQPPNKGNVRDRRMVKYGKIYKGSPQPSPPNKLHQIKRKGLHKVTRFPFPRRRPGFRYTH